MIGSKRPNQNGESSIVSETVLQASSSTGPPPLKLRMKHQSTIQKFTIDVHEAKSPQEKISRLLHFSHQLRVMHIRSEECEQLLRLLKDIVKKDTDYMLRSKAIELMADVCCMPVANKMQCIEEIIDSLHKENNHVVISQIFTSLSRTVILIPSKADVILKTLKSAVKKLDDTHHDVRCACLNLIGRISPPDPIKISSGRVVDALELFSEFSSDQDPRVRAVVYQSLLTLHQRGRALDVNVYDKACAALNDDYESVRLAAIKLIWVFSHTCPDRMLPSVMEKNEEMRLLDDAFIKICNMANDISMKVRAEAVGLLGSFHKVSFYLLQQTLDKKLMSHGRKSKSFNQRQLERFRGQNNQGGGGAWSTGKTWGDNDPSSLKEGKEDEVKLMNTGSCGVFVKSLEDEFLEVRTAGVDSLCELANQDAAFAHMSTDFLVDMFNDEIESVRLNSIHSLIKLYRYVDLREDQLDTILECLNDYNQVVRNSVRDLLSHCKLSTQACLYATVLALLANLKKYPNDRESIWRCMKELGFHHPFFVSSLVPQLFVTHPYYAVPEPNIDDPNHIAIAALVFNATTKFPSILSLLPSFAKQHYDYLRESLPKLIPVVLNAENNPGTETEEKEATHAEVNQFFNATVQRLHSALQQPSSRCDSILLTCLKDFDYVKRLHDSVTPAAEFLSLFVKCYQILQKCRNDRTWSLPVALATNECGSLQNDVEELINLSYKMEFLFSGITSSNTSVLRMIRVLAHCLWVLLALRNMDKTSHQHQHNQQQQKIQFKLWESFFQRIVKFKEHISTSSLAPDHFKSVFVLQEAIEQNLSNVSTLFNLLQDFFRTEPINTKIENRLRQACARITEPQNNVDNPLRFSAGLILAVDVVAWLKNVDNICDIFIKVVYPDMSVTLHKPKLTEFECISSAKHRLCCKLLLSHQSWTESSHVKISIVLAHPTDIKKELNHSVETNTTDRIVRSATGFVDSFKSYIDLSNVEKVYIQPKAVTR